MSRRKVLAFIGNALSEFSWLVFPLAGSIGWVFTGRLIDRIGKGIRVAPRDALVAEYAPANMRRVA